MKKIFYLLLIFFVTNIVAQQSSNFDFFEKIEFEKVLISYYKVEDKTTSAPPSSLFSDTEEEISDEKVKKIGESELTKKEFCGIYNLLEKNINFTHVLEPYTNVSIDFYKHNQIYQNISISTFSKNIKINKVGCKSVHDENGNEIYPCLFLGSMNPKLEKYINNLLGKIN